MAKVADNPSNPAQLNEPSSDSLKRPDDLSSQSHRQLIGYIGLLLPALIIIIVLLRDGRERWEALDSISAYYYTGAVAAFVGMLIALALFLFTYHGYKNKYYWADRATGITAATAALGVALFPTGAPTGVQPLSWWTPETGIIHGASAVVLFSMFAVYALWLFRLTASKEHMEPEKRWRNRAYFACGLIIVGSIIWALVAGLNDKSIFVPESIALVAFAISWLIKGHALRTIGNTARSLVARHTA